MKKLILILITYLFVITLIAQPEAKFQEAVKLYEQESYSEAAEVFKSIINEGNINSELFFNLANCYYRSSEFGLAVLNYERALKIDPTNEDAKFNLKLANLNLVDSIEEPPVFFLIEYWNIFVNIFTSEYWAYFSIAWLWISGVFLVLFVNRIGKKKLNLLLALICLAVGVTILIIGFGVNINENRRNEAIVMQSSVYIKSSPESKGTDLLILHEGVKLIILDEVGEWFKVRIPDGNVGWLERNAIEII